MSEKTNEVAVAGQNTPAAKTETKPKTTTMQAKKGDRPEIAILTRFNDKKSADSLYTIILQLSGGDPLFVDKFAQCCKMQVDKHWKKTDKGWYNPYLLIPLNAQLDALYRCAAKRVLPDGYNCNLIPYIGREEKRLDVSIDYKGLGNSFIQEKVIMDYDAAEVCENDIFAWRLGDVTEWSFDPRHNRGRVCGYCAWAVLPDGRKKWKYMSVEEIADVRKCAKTQMIWNKWEGEMSKKTVIRRLFKTLPNTPKLRGLIELDNEAFDMERDETGAYAMPQKSRSPVRRIVGATAALPAPQNDAPMNAEAEDIPEAIPVDAVAPKQEQAQTVAQEPLF